MKTSIDELIERVIEREGGYVNNPADAGLATNFGITLATLHSWREVPVSAADVQALTKAEAHDIYKDRYFTRPGFDAVTDPELQEMLFDFGINSGPTAAVMALQTALGVTADGSFGPMSRAALAACTNIPALYYKVKCERYELYLRYIGRSPSQAVFAAGWANRMDTLEDKP